MREVPRRSPPRPPPNIQEDSPVRQAAPPHMARSIRLIYRTLQLTHHLSCLSDEHGAKGKERIHSLANDLKSMIKPAALNETTRQLLNENARTWGQETIKILKTHYETEIKYNVDQMDSIVDHDWVDAFMVAKRWAKNSLPRIKQTTLQQVEDLILDGACFKRNPIELDMSTLTENTPDPSKNSPTAQERGDEANTPVRRRGTGVSFPQDSSTQPPPEPTTSSPGPSQREPRSELSDRTDADPPPALQANFDLEPATDSDTDEEEGSQVYKIEKHKVTNRKKEDWSLRVTRPVLILGDSNVARIKDHTFPFLQIDSFPGANLLHATELLRNTPNQPQVERGPLLWAEQQTAKTERDRH
uniref:Uncharacterized protein n=1 Tax=Knipowitschia caucasica TaxID=637954 RepID=A0AAV2LVI6_KNICA